jgi:hypothetical protein
MDEIKKTIKKDDEKTRLTVFVVLSSLMLGAVFYLKHRWIDVKK